MKKGILTLIVVLTVIIIFVFTKGTTNAPSDDMLGGTSETDTETTSGEDVGLSDTGASEQNTPDTIVNVPIEEALVTYGPNGFGPKTVTIQTGQTVTFVNESENAMWVAASKHPVHADYPEKTANDCLGSAFDQCTASSIGTSYSFAFNKKGSWNYHNHVNPGHWGTVVVQ